MQSLWSRAGQAHRCGCRACDTVITGLGRRASTAAQRRKPTFAEVFTACYSSVFATAAVVDAIGKEDRRQELDRQLDETRRELAELTQLCALETSRSTTIPDDAPAKLSIEQMDVMWKKLKDIYTNRPFMKEIHKPVALRISEDLDRIKNENYNCPDKATMKALGETNYEDLELAILAEETNRLIYQRSAKNKKQLHNDARVTVHLIKQLLDRADKHDTSSAPSPAFDKALKLANERSHAYTFTHIDPRRVTKTTTELNKHLREIVNSPTMSLKEKVGRVCYNLLVSPYTPSMHTYNTLIVAFDKRGHGPMAESLVNTFFHSSRLRPTPSTFLAILNHYKVTNNHGRFMRALASITGLDTETGAKMGRRHCEDVYVNSDSYFDRAKWRTQTGEWIWDHVPLTQPLVESIMGGLLHFKLFDQAANLFLSCMKAKIILRTDAIKQLFDECIIALDWRAALRLVRGFADYEKKWPQMLLERESEEVSYLVDRVFVLLDICGLSQQGHSVSSTMLSNLGIVKPRYHRFLCALEKARGQEAAVTVGDADKSEILDAVRASENRLLQIESLWKEQALVGRTRLSIESKLLSSDLSLQFRSLMAMHVSQSATQESLNLNQDFVEATSKLNAPWLQKTLADCAAFQTSMEAHLEAEAEAKAEAEATRSALEVVEEVEDEVSELSTQFDKQIGPWQPTTALSVERASTGNERRKQLRDRPERERFFSWSVPQPTQTQRAASAYS